MKVLRSRFPESTMKLGSSAKSRSISEIGEDRHRWMFTEDVTLVNALFIR